MVATIFVRRGTPPRYWPVGGGRGCEDARMELLVIRHALPVRIEGVDGPADPPLSDLGLRQAEALSRLPGFDVRQLSNALRETSGTQELWVHPEGGYAVPEALLDDESPDEGS